MEKTLLIIIAATWLCTVLSRQYHFIYDRKTMSEARRYCRENYIDLATVENMEDVNILNQMANLSQMKYSPIAWIGLYDDVNSWRWSLSNTSFYQGGDMNFRNWFRNQPDNYKGGQLCTNMQADGAWNDDNCANCLPAICVDLRGPNVTFVLTKNLKWSDAQSYCRSHHTDLASVRSEAENQKIEEVAAGRLVWIGLFRDPWKWVDGSKSTFRNWNTVLAEPNNVNNPETCVVANFDNYGRWEDWPCDTKVAFICYTKSVNKKQVIRLQLKTSSSLDLNDPAVMEQILNQLKERMKGKKEDVSLSWKKQSDGQCFQKKNKKNTKNKRTVTGF